VTFIAMLKIIALSFDERRFASLVGISMLVGNLGSVLAGAPLSWLAQITGWRGIFVGLAAVSLLLGVGCWWLLRESGRREGQVHRRAGRQTTLRPHGGPLRPFVGARKP
jgi:predicted MFS family arabinose efflux permease